MAAVKSLITEYNNITHVFGTKISNNLPIWTGGFRFREPGKSLTWRWSDGSKFDSFMNCQRSSYIRANENDRIAINEPTQVLTQSSKACFWMSHEASIKYPYICQVDFRKSKIHTELNISVIKSFFEILAEKCSVGEITQRGDVMIVEERKTAQMSVTGSPEPEYALK